MSENYSNSTKKGRGDVHLENEPLVSIIIPVFNVAPYLCEGLDSVINQKYKELEIIIIDDGSTDGSENICDEYAKKDERIKVVHQENRGLSAARNVGLDIMTGEVVAFLDPDDAFYLDFIKTMVITMVLEKSDIVICKFSIQTTVEKLEYDGSGAIYPKLSKKRYDRISALHHVIDGTIDVAVC